MKYQHQRVDLRSFLLREVPKSQLSPSLRRRLSEALAGGDALRHLATEVVRELVRQGTLQVGARLREGPDRIPLYVLPGSSRAYDLRGMLPEDDEAGARSEPPAVQVAPNAPPVPEATPPPAEPPPLRDGHDRWSLEALRRTLQRDWVSYGPEASLEVVMEELAQRLGSPRIHLRLVQSELPQRIESGLRWTVFTEGDSQATDWLRRIRNAGTPILEAGTGEVWSSVTLAEEVVGALQAPRETPRDLLLAAAETVSALLGALHRSRRRVFMDPLTGLNNRGFFEQQIEVEVERSQRSKQELALLFVDIDHFKQVNDEYGHDAGDAVLQSVAHKLVEGLRRIDSVSRWGGEEFAMLLPATARDQAVFIAERLRTSIEESSVRLADGREIRVTVSMGVAVAPEHASGGQKALLRHADQALYEAKRGGRNRVCLADASDG